MESAEALVYTVNDLERMGARDEAKTLVSDSLTKVSQMEQTSLTRWYRDEITKRCGHLFPEDKPVPIKTN